MSLVLDKLQTANTVSPTRRRTQVVSSISWLDASSDEQKRMRELLGLFMEKESREELGLGQIRDAVADGLFPGTSTLHTRAKYLLFIPWIFQLVSARGGNQVQARNQELALIKALKMNGRNDQGIIGSDAGSTLKTVPSSLYWSALSAFGILNRPDLSREQAIALEGMRAVTDEAMSGTGDLGTPQFRAWRSSLPEPPQGFPAEVPRGMELTREESSWLQERIVDSTAGSLLAHLSVHFPESDSAVPWEDPNALTATGKARRLLDHSEKFSDTMQGAQLTYNLLIAESYEGEGFTRVEGRREHYAQRLTEWGNRYASRSAQEPWDIEQFFAMITAIRGSRVASGSESFVREWARQLQTHDPRDLANQKGARDLVRQRERRNKGAMARIGNRKRLETWGGTSGAGRYVYRWGYVQAILRDIQEGLMSRDDSNIEDGVVLRVGGVHA